jgi:hypothetical protein
MLKRVRSRGARAILGAMGALLIVAVTAIAYFASVSGGKGSGETKLGAGEGTFLTYKVTLNEGLKPGQETPIEITTANTTAQETDIGSWSMSFSIDPASVERGCQASWFEISFKTKPETKEWSEMLEKTKVLPIKAGEEVVVSSRKEGTWGMWGADYFLKFKEEAVNQSACEYAIVTVTAESKV